MRLSRLSQPMTSRLTVMPVRSLNLSSSGCRTDASCSRLVPWLLAQYVMVVPASDSGSSSDPQATTSGITSAADNAAALSLLSLTRLLPFSRCVGRHARAAIGCLYPGGTVSVTNGWRGCDVPEYPDPLVTALAASVHRPEGLNSTVVLWC